MSGLQGPILRLMGPIPSSKRAQSRPKKGPSKVMWSKMTCFRFMEGAHSTTRPFTWLISSRHRTLSAPLVSVKGHNKQIYVKNVPHSLSWRQQKKNTNLRLLHSGPGMRVAGFRSGAISVPFVVLMGMLTVEKVVDLLAEWRKAVIFPLHY